MATQTIEKNHAIDNAQGWWQRIVEMVAAVDAAEHGSREHDEANERIQESVLSVEVRDGWRVPGSEIVGNPVEEYMILLTTGGPALRIYGRTNRYGEPDENPVLQWQDWGTPWTDWYPADMENYRDMLRDFARHFYFGE